MNADTVKTVAVAGVVAAVAFVVWRSSKAAGQLLGSAGDALSSAAGVVGTAINPASPDNLVNRAAQSLGQAITGDDGFTIGGAIHETVNGGPTGNLWGNYWDWAGRMWGVSSGASKAVPQATYDETARLLRRYPAPTPTTNASAVDHFDEMGNFVGTW